ncbi:LytR C-terminal domain-containing protein [Actinokineospora inagensis]|uniref:LytR C-terminal domain-containing protein n=1 Tax=Actinokineospora inagensis TaxID=103730 RepID=UPI0003FF81AD|nr:LytR C-terminal domain-containing protein [Actinokineospora inagensis]
MTTETGVRPRTARVAGLTLLAVAAASAVIGVITLFDGGGGQPTAQPPAATTTTAQLPPPATTAASPAPTSAQAPTTQQSTTQQPTTTTAAAPPPATTVPPGTQPQSTGPLRIYNNSTIPRLAADAAKDIRNAGWTVTEVGNYAEQANGQGRIATTTVYYEPGTTEEADAHTLAARFGFRVEERFAGIKSASPGLILIVTNDYKNNNK